MPKYRSNNYSLKFDNDKATPYKRLKTDGKFGHKKSKSGLNAMFKPLLLGAEGGI